MIKSIAIYKPNNAVEKFVLKKAIRQPNSTDAYFVTKIDLISDTSVLVTFSTGKVTRYAGMPFECEEEAKTGKKTEGETE